LDERALVSLAYSVPVPDGHRSLHTRRAAFSQSIARLQQGSSAAATTLLKVMLDPNSPASTRVRAAESVLNHAAKAIELEDIEARVAALEEATRKDAPRR
jgi:hypothetical protein